MDEEYNLKPGEVIIMQTGSVLLVSGKDEEELDELVLTNKNLILVNEVSTGLFSSQRLLKRCPLDSIACPDGTPQAFLGKKRNDYVLQVVFEQEAMTFMFANGDKKREAKRWADAIKYASVGQLDNIDTEESPLPKDVTNLIDGIKGFATAFAAEMSDVGSEVSNTATPTKKAVKTKVAAKCPGCHAPLSGNKGSILTCEYCGTKQTL